MSSLIFRLLLLLVIVAAAVVVDVDVDVAVAEADGVLPSTLTLFLLLLSPRLVAPFLDFLEGLAVVVAHSSKAAHHTKDDDFLVVNLCWKTRRTLLNTCASNKGVVLVGRLFR